MWNCSRQVKVKGRGGRGRVQRRSRERARHLAGGPHRLDQGKILLCLTGHWSLDKMS